MFKPKKDIINKVSEKQKMDELEEMKSEGNAPVDTGTEAAVEKTIDELSLKISDLTDRLLRKSAEFENYKKRIDNELSSYYKYANEKLIVDLLPILDDFERLNGAWDEKHDAEKYKEGIDLISEKMKKVLKQHGVKEMNSLGKPFDVDLHDALLQVPKDNVEPNTVVDEVEKGYYLKDKVIRHAKVIVSSKPE